jgi:hypothetical protein
MAASLTGLVIAFGASHEPQVEQSAQRTLDSAFLYRSDNVAAQILILSAIRTGDVVVDHFQPRTALGRRLLALRRAHVLGGGKLLGWDEIDTEVRSRRGGRADV